MNTAPTAFSGLSKSRLTAYGAVLLLFGALAWSFNQEPAVVATNTQPNAGPSEIDDEYLRPLADSVAAQSPEGITYLGTNILAQTVLEYDAAVKSASSSDAGLAAVKAYGESVKPAVSYKTYASSDIKTSPETSKDRVLAYRADLRIALEPLLENKVYELDIFAKYVETKDPKNLTELQTVAQNYRQAILNTEKVVAPEDAAIYQASILTAMSKFAATLDALSMNATDPFASAALMRTFLDAQDTMLASFDSIAKYSQRKLL